MHPAARFGLASASSSANPYCCGKASSDALILRYLFLFFIAALGSRNVFVYLTFLCDYRSLFFFFSNLVGDAFIDPRIQHVTRGHIKLAGNISSKAKQTNK